MKIMARINERSTIIIGLMAILLLPTLAIGRGTTDSCGEALSSEFVIKKLNDTSGKFVEKDTIPCHLQDGNFVFWKGDQYSTLKSGASNLPDSDKVKQTDSIGSKTFEYDGSFMGHTVEVGFLTAKKNYTVMVTLIGKDASLEKARMIASEIHDNLNNK